MAIERVGVVGGGQMGAGIAEVCARGGCDVLIFEISNDAAEAARAKLTASLGRALKNEKIDQTTHDEILARLRVTTEFSDLADRQFVFEAVAENLAVKEKIFSDLDRTVTDPEAIFATNTSSIPVIQVAMASSRPGAILGLHFFNPPTVMKLVEVVPSLLTDEEVTARARSFVDQQLGKTTILSQDRSGFVVNALLAPFLVNAIRMLEAGFASAEDIDTGVQLGLSHPMGPLTLCDMIGLDTIHAVAESLYEEFREPTYAPPPLLTRMVQAGMLGRKSGRGFYDYS
jgi:3-hydroxybutyryl-CoA dehydrogenase